MEKNKWHHAHNGGSSAVYGMGLIGALIYTFQHATSFGDGLLRILESLVWPAILVYKVFEIWKF